MRTLLICHEGAALDRDGLARWLESFSTVVGTLVVREPHGRLRTRIAREIARVGPWRFLDVLAFRAYYRLTAARGDQRWAARELARLHARFPGRPSAPDLDAVRDTLLSIDAGAAVPIDTSGRPSAAWGQPWLSAHLRMRAVANRKSRVPGKSHVPEVTAP